MRKHILQAVTLCAVCVLAPPFAQAEEARDEATKLIELADGLYSRRMKYPDLRRQAIEQYRKFLREYRNDPRCEGATLRLGNCLREQGNHPEALQVYLAHQKFRASENRDAVNFRTGQTYFSLGQYPEAIQCLLRVYNKKVEENLSSSVALWLGWAYLKNDQPAKAVPVLTELADGKRNPLVPWANFHLGYALLATEKLDKAIERFQKAAAALPPRRAEALFRIAEAYAKLKKYPEAYSAYRELVEKHLESEFRGPSAFGAVWSLYSAKDYQNATKVYGICSNLIPAESQARAAYIVGNSYWEMNKLTDALRIYRRVAKEFPTSPFAADADYKACWCLYELGNHDEVIASGATFIKKHSKYPDIGNIYFLVGESLYERNRISESLLQYQAVVTRYPKSPFREKASFKFALCYLKTEQLEKARESFRDFATSYPQNELAAKALARSAECGLSLARKKDAKPEFQQAQYAEVARDYQALVEKYPNDPLAGEALYQLGVTYARLDKHEDMVNAFRKLVKDYPKHENCAEAYYWLGKETEKTEQYDIAADYFNRSITLKPKGPYSEEAKYRLAGIYSMKDEKAKAVSLIVEMLKENLESKIPAETHLGAADFLLDKAKYDEAIEVYNLFLKKFKARATPLLLERAYYGLGDSYFKTGQWQEAVDNLEKAVEFKGAFVTLASLHSGIAHLKLGQNKQAEDLLREVARSRVFELEAKAYYWLGNMHFATAKTSKTQQQEAKQYEAARLEYLRVVIMYTDSDVRPECMYRAAECFEQQSSLQNADAQLLEQGRKLLRELIDAYPEHDFARKAREKLGTAPTGASGQ